MGSIDHAGEGAITSVLTEALEEISGESKSKWGLIVVALLLGGAVAAVVAVKLRARKAAQAVASDALST